MDPSKNTKKRRAPKKKPNIIELDDAKEEVDVLKSRGHWNDHWVIQLIIVCGKMDNTFSALPKQGTVPNSFFLYFCFGFLFGFNFVRCFLIFCFSFCLGASYVTCPFVVR